MADGLTDDQVFGSGGGMTDDQVFGSPPPTAAQAVGRGLGLGARNVVEGVLGAPYDLIARGINATGLLPPIRPFSENLTSLGLPAPQTPFERGASAVIEPVAGTLVGQGVGRALTTAASPVVQAVGDALTQQPVVQGIAAGVGGATTAATGNPALGTAASILTPLAGAGLGAAGRGAENLLLGRGISDADAQLGRTALDKYNIPIPAADLSSNSILRTATDQSGKLPFGGGAASREGVQTAWQGAIAKEMGEPSATAFTPQVMTAAKTRIGQAFDDVAARTSIPPSETSVMGMDMDAIIPDAKTVLTADQMTPLQNQVDAIKGLAANNNGTISGDAYQALTRSGAPLDRLEGSTDPNVAFYAGKVRDALDDAFMRSAAPADQDALGQARYQYRVMRTVDPLVAGSRDGNISPDAFMQKVLTASRRFDAPTGGMAYTGGGNIGELARIGKLMRAAPNSGTTDRALVTGAVLGGGELLPNLVHHPELMAVAPAGLAANRLLGSYLRSPATASRLINAAIGPGAAPQTNPLLQAFQTSGVTALENQYQNRFMPGQ